MKPKTRSREQRIALRRGSAIGIALIIAFGLPALARIFLHGPVAGYTVAAIVVIVIVAALVYSHWGGKNLEDK